jgi:hypothetical protein
LQFPDPTLRFGVCASNSLPPNLPSESRVVIDEANANAMLSGRRSGSQTGRSSADNEHVELFFSGHHRVGLKTPKLSVVPLSTDSHTQRAENLAAALMQPSIDFCAALKANSHSAKNAPRLPTD